MEDQLLKYTCSCMKEIKRTNFRVVSARCIGLLQKKQFTAVMYNEIT